MVVAGRVVVVVVGVGVFFRPWVPVDSNCPVAVCEPQPIFAAPLPSSTLAAGRQAGRATKYRMWAIRGLLCPVQGDPVWRSWVCLFACLPSCPSPFSHWFLWQSGWGRRAEREEERQVEREGEKREGGRETGGERGGEERGMKRDRWREREGGGRREGVREREGRGECQHRLFGLILISAFVHIQLDTL